MNGIEPPPQQQPACLILEMFAELVEAPARMIKLYKSIALHRLLVVLINSNPSVYVVGPCLRIMESCLVTSGVESFQRSFETEGGFALLARTLGSLWRKDIQSSVFRMLVGPVDEAKTLLCPPMVTCLLAALDEFFQAAGEGDEGGTRPTHGRTRSGTVTSIRSVAMSPINTSMS